jgi:hypothetical protein
MLRRGGSNNVSCNCPASDAWRCAKAAKRRDVIACQCECHRRRREQQSAAFGESIKKTGAHYTAELLASEVFESFHRTGGALYFVVPIPGAEPGTAALVAVSTDERVAREIMRVIEETELTRADEVQTVVSGSTPLHRKQ